MSTPKRFRDIPQLIPCSGGYEITVPWGILQRTLRDFEQEYGLDTDPDFQRDHVWTRQQQIAYVEFCLRGGRTARTLQWNCRSWYQDHGTRSAEGEHPLVLVDGKQRLTAVLAFLHDEIPAFGVLCSEYEDRLGPGDPCFRFHINGLATRAEVLEWYLQMNAGGTVHTQQELDNVRAMIEEEAG